MASRAVAAKSSDWMAPLRKWAYNLSGFNKYGLHHDDVLREDEDVKEALKRLPDPVKQLRNYRLVRAMQLEMAHEILPKEQWTKYEEDDKYLTPIIEQVRKERQERENWEKEN